jgi:hypothetical protein
MKGILTKTNRGWVVKQVVKEGPDAKLINQYPLVDNGHIDGLKLYDSNEGLEVDFEIIHCIPEDLEPTRGETLSFESVKYAKLIFVPGLSKETLDELFSLHDPEDFIDEDSEDWERASLEDYKDEKDEELLIELEEWNHTCGDGCCYTYGVDIFVNGEQIKDEDGTNPHQLLTAVLNKLGYTNVQVEYKYNG